jgi:hypothetical protein
VVSSSNPQHAFDFGIVAESAKSFANSDVHAPESNGATEHGATVEASRSHTQSGRQGDQPSKSMPMPNQATSSDRAELANSFLSFEEMDRIAREKLQVIGQAQAVLREAFRDLDPIFVQMRAMLSQRGENRVPEDETNKLPGIKKWWTQLCEEYGVNFSFRGFQKPRWSPQKRPYVVTQKPANGIGQRPDGFSQPWSFRATSLARGRFRVCALLPLVRLYGRRHLE